MFQVKQLFQVNVNEHTSGNINMCSSYITPDMCYTSLNPGDEFEGDLEVKSEPESEDGSLSIVQNLTTVYDNQMTTTTLSKAQTEEIEDEPMVTLQFCTTFCNVYLETCF